MDITKETSIQTERRLRSVLAAATRTIVPGQWHYQEFAADQFDTSARRDALALVRRGDAWSQLVPVTSDVKATEPMCVWTFTFSADAPNSGFVGWLASLIKQRTGSGVVVICGYDADNGGVYDHWGCPAAAGPEVLALIEELATQ